MATIVIANIEWSLILFEVLKKNHSWQWEFKYQLSRPSNKTNQEVSHLVVYLMLMIWFDLIWCFILSFLLLNLIDSFKESFEESLGMSLKLVFFWYSFPTGQFYIPGYTIPYRLDRTVMEVKYFLFKRGCTFNLNTERKTDKRSFCLSKSNKKKWLLCYSYNVNKALNTQSSKRNQNQYWKELPKLWKFYPSRWH